MSEQKIIESRKWIGRDFDNLKNIYKGHKTIFYYIKQIIKRKEQEKKYKLVGIEND